LPRIHAIRSSGRKPIKKLQLTSNSIKYITELEAPRIRGGDACQCRHALLGKATRFHIELLVFQGKRVPLSKRFEINPSVVIERWFAHDEKPSGWLRPRPMRIFQQLP
jgi:hypothetical protein